MTTKKKIIEELRKTIGTFEDSFGFNGTIEELADSILGLVKQEIVEEIEELDGEFERDDESNFIKGWRAALEKIKIKILIKQ